MEQLKNHLEKAYHHLSRLQVSGDAVDLVALVRMELRMAHEELKQKETNKEEVKENGQAD